MKIQWNNVTWYSKFIALVLFVALPFIGFYYGMQYGKITALIGYAPIVSGTSTSTIGSDTADYYNDPAEWQTDANNVAGGFSIAYPIDFDAQDNYPATPSTDWRMNSNNVMGAKYFTLTIPRAFEPQTNLVGVAFTVGASGNAAAVAQCLAADPSGDQVTATSTATVNGIDFTVFKSSDVGAGSYYETTSYRTLHGGKCYAIEYTVHSAQIANYPAAYNLQPFNEQKIDSLMKNIVGTFTFTK